MTNCPICHKITDKCYHSRSYFYTVVKKQTKQIAKLKEELSFQKDEVIGLMKILNPK